MLWQFYPSEVGHIIAGYMNVNINNSQGGTVIITPPYHSQPREWRKGWAKKLRIGKLYFYVSNCRMKKRPIRDLMYAGYAADKCVFNKHNLYEQQDGKCPHCGKPFEYEQMELHHILPLSRFPELGKSQQNGVMLCRKCHKEVVQQKFTDLLNRQGVKVQRIGIQEGAYVERTGNDDDDIENGDNNGNTNGSVTGNSDLTGNNDSNGGSTGGDDNGNGGGGQDTGGADVN